MRKRESVKNKIIVAILGTFLLVGLALLCYFSVEKAIVESEQESMKSLAKVNARSLMASLQAKSNLIYAALSGDMEDEEDIRKGMLKVGEKGNYIPLNQLEELEGWRQKECKEAGVRPGEVVSGPIFKSDEGYYVLCMTKAVYMDQSIAGYVQIELNLDEIYTEEQALSNLQLANGGYCIVKDAEGRTIMPGSEETEEFSIAQKEKSRVLRVWTYKTEYGVPQKIQKLVSYETIDIDGEELNLYIIEDYQQIIRPVRRVAVYFCLFGILIFSWTGFFIYKTVTHQKEEEQGMLMQKYNHSKTMEVLSGAIAHEFNNMMTPIVLYAEIFEENETVCRELPEEVSELKSTAKRCEELAGQLLNYSRQGRIERQTVEYDASMAVQESVNMIEKLLPKNIRLRTNLCRTPYYVKGQLGSLNQILLNLSTNAIYEMKEEGGSLNISFGLSLDSDRFLRLIVEDTGKGIPAEVQRQIFRPFFTTKAAGEGTGIGLTVVKRLAEEHGGSIFVKTEEGKGTRFLLEFPRVFLENEMIKASGKLSEK